MARAERRRRRSRRVLLVAATAALVAVGVGVGAFIGTDRDPESVSTAGAPETSVDPSTTIVQDPVGGSVSPIPADGPIPADAVADCVRSDDAVVTFTVDPSGPPRCVVVAPGQQLAVTNARNTLLLVAVGPYDTPVDPGATEAVADAVRAALAPGLHVIDISGTSSVTALDLMVGSENG